MQPQNIPQNNQSSVMSPHMSDTASMKTESPADVKNQMPNTPGSMNSMVSKRNRIEPTDA